MSKVICISEYRLKRDNPSLLGELYDNRSEDDLLKEVNDNKNKEKDNVIYIKPKVKRRRPKK